MPQIDSLFPVPGSKRAKKYDILKPLPNQTAICEPFMGGAARSLLHPHCQPILGEINPAHRMIALAPTSDHRRKAFIQAYQQTRSTFLNSVDLNPIERAARERQSQKAFKQIDPALYECLGDRWKQLRYELFQRIQRYEVADWELAGFYAFMQRASFGNVMRLNPSNTDFNMAFHVDKLRNAIAFDPAQWIELLQFQKWNPQVLSHWEAAIEVVESPQSAYLLLDPPYWTDGKTSKMTPCYPGHSIGLRSEHDETLALSTRSLLAGLIRRFPLIHLCNYWSERLEGAIVGMALEHGYSIRRVKLGVCGALGNSNGRFKHGERIDRRERPIECIWEFRAA